jgi:hypothetical protein
MNKKGENQEKNDERFHYPTRCIRLPDETWDWLKSEKIKSGKSWNLFLLTFKKRKKNGN